MYIYWRIEQDLNCLGETIAFICPGLRRSYFLWMRKHAACIALAEGLTIETMIRPSMN